MSGGDAAAPNGGNRASLIKRRGRNLAIGMTAVSVIALAWLLSDSEPTYGERQRPEWFFGLPPSAPLIWSMMLLASAVRHKRIHGRFSQGRLFFAALLLVSMFLSGTPERSISAAASKRPCNRPASEIIRPRPERWPSG